MEQGSSKKVHQLEQKIESLGAANLKMTYVLSELQSELAQRTKTIDLVTQIAGKIAGKSDPKVLAKEFVLGLRSGLNMTAAGYWAFDASKKSFSAQFVDGVTTETEELRFEAPKLPWVRVVNGKYLKQNTELEPWLESFRKILATPFVVVVPVFDNETLFGVLVAGRAREARPLSSPLNEVDGTSLAALATLFSSSLKSVRALFLEEVDRIKSEFFANISHELRTPITLSLVPIEMILKGDLGAIQDAQRNQLEVVRRTQKNLLQLVNQILDLAKLESGREALEPEPVVDLGGWFRQRLAFFEQPAKQKGLNFNVNVGAELNKIHVQLDTRRFERILNNLVSNALKYTPKGLVEITVNLEKGNLLQLKVRDSGVGFTQEEIPHLFERFRRFQSARKTGAIGTGLGLSLIKGIVDLFSGTIGISSVEGEWSEFVIRIPLQLSKGSEIQLPRSEEDLRIDAETSLLEKNEVLEDSATASVEPPFVTEKNDPNDQRPCIFYVDDNPDLRQLVRSILSKEFRVQTYNDGEYASQALDAEMPDLVISDLMMPRVDGIELLSRIRKHKSMKDLPFLLMTASPDEANRILALNAGADDFLFKPFHAPEVVARTRNLVKLRKSQTSLRKELEAAKKLQHQLLPKIPFLKNNYVIDAYYSPCEQLSGDSFDIFTQGEYLYTYVADVTSHGTPAAQVTFLLKTMIREILGSIGGSHSLGQILRAVQRKYHEFQIPYDVALQILRVKEDSRAYEYIHSECVPFLHYNPSTNFSRVKLKSSSSISANTEDAWQEGEVKSGVIEPGQAILMMTDGSVASESTLARSWKRVEKELLGLSPDLWREKLQQFYGDVGSQDDDQTLLWIYLKNI